MRMELRLRFDYGHVVPWVRHRRRRARPRSPGRTPSGCTRPVEVDARRRTCATVAEFRSARATRCRSCSPTRPSHLPAPSRSTPTGAATTPRNSGPTGRPCRYDGQVATTPSPVADHPQGADLRPDRRHRRGGHDVAARAARRRPQLGLPLLLAARRHLHAAGAARHRLPRGGQGLARLAAARRRRRPGRPADHVRARRARRRCRSTSCPGCRLRGVRAGAGRQRRRRPVPARRLGRGARRRCTSPAAGSAPTRRLGAAARAAGLPRGRLGAAGQQAVGGPRPAAARSCTPRSWHGPGWTGRCRPSSGSGSRGRWTVAGAREEIHDDVCAKGYDADRRTFTQFYGSEGLDAARPDCAGRCGPRPCDRGCRRGRA